MTEPVNVLTDAATTLMNVGNGGATGGVANTLNNVASTVPSQLRPAPAAATTPAPATTATPPVVTPTPIVNTGQDAPTALNIAGEREAFVDEWARDPDGAAPVRTWRDVGDRTTPEGQYLSAWYDTPVAPSQQPFNDTAAAANQDAIAAHTAAASPQSPAGVAPLPSPFGWFHNFRQDPNARLPEPGSGPIRPGQFETGNDGNGQADGPGGEGGADAGASPGAGVGDGSVI